MMIEDVIRSVRRGAMKAYIATKTAGAYTRQLRKAVLDLYRGGDEFDFIDTFTGAIENQFNRAFREGAREAGVDPRDFTDTDLAYIEDKIKAEHEYVLDFAQAVIDARGADAGTGGLYSRVDMWANRYNEIVSDAKLRFSTDRLEWKYGDTEHCEDCLMLNGKVGTADEWRESGWQPQSRDLECHGYHCQCKLEITDKPRSRGGIPKKT